MSVLLDYCFWPGAGFAIVEIIDIEPTFVLPSSVADL